MMVRRLLGLAAVAAILLGALLLITGARFGYHGVRLFGALITAAGCGPCGILWPNWSASPFEMRRGGDRAGRAGVSPRAALLSRRCVLSALRMIPLPRGAGIDHGGADRRATAFRYPR